jgi:FkbM family methyltransferase
MNPQHIVPQLLLRAWPFPHGSGRLTDRLFGRLAFKDKTATVRTTDGFDITVMPNDLIGRHLYLTGEFDRSTVRVLRGLSRPGDTLLDIGANIGYVSAAFLKLVPNSNVVAVDPQPGIIDLLRTNLAPFRNRARILPVALSDQDGTMNFFVDPYNKGASKIVYHNGPGTVQVETWSAETLIARSGVDKIDLIKIDVEGHETQVISALLPAIQKFKPRAILFEDHGVKAAPEGTIGSLLKSADYKVTGMKKRLTGLDMIPINSVTDCVCNDYIAQPA